MNLLFLSVAVNDLQAIKSSSFLEPGKQRWLHISSVSNMATVRPFVTLDQISPITTPPPLLCRDFPANKSAPTLHELDALSFGALYTGPSTYETHASATPASPHIDFERSRSPTPSIHEDTAPIVQTLSNPSMNKYRFLSACLMCFGNGLNDSAPGALLPSMKSHYRVGYAAASTIFILNAVGFILAFPLSHALLARLGRAKTLVLAQSFMTLAYVLLVCEPPFPFVVCSFFFAGLGMALNLALNNVFCANLAHASQTLGGFHGSYGIGGTVGPLIATAFVSRHGGGAHGKGGGWSAFYFVPLGIAVLNAGIAYFTFRTYENDNPPLAINSEGRLPSSSKTQLLVSALRNRSTLLGALFVFAYQGAEVSISGWLISFLIAYRHSNPARVGFVTAGFWGGITLGRFLLAHSAHLLGEKRAVAVLTAAAAALQLLVWWIPNMVGEAVAVVLMGLLLGPIYSCATMVISQLVDHRLQMSSLAAVSAVGSSGGAVAPFLTGLVAQRAGTWVLHPICLGLFMAMGGCWVGLPKMGKRQE